MTTAYDPMPDVNARTYTAHLAGYISDPSTVRVRVLDRFGHAPSLDQIRAVRAEIEAQRGKPCNYLLLPEHDAEFCGIAKDFAPRSLVKAPKRKVYVPPEPMPFREPPTPPRVIGRPTVRDLALYAARLTYTCFEDVMGKSRFAEHVTARDAVILAAHGNGTGYSHLGRQFGRDHSTMMTAVKRSQRRVQTDPAFGELVAALSKVGEK